VGGKERKRREGARRQKEREKGKERVGEKPEGVESQADPGGRAKAGCSGLKPDSSNFSFWREDTSALYG
jgi:hypothetical protein